MQLFHFENNLIVEAPLEEVWAFFLNPNNLKKLIPPRMDFRLPAQVPDKMYEGLIIKYTVKPLLAVSMSWTGEITEIKEYRYFIDEQQKGPFAHWRHRHVFLETREGTEVRDDVQYMLPFGLVGMAAVPFVRRQLETLFLYRNQTLNDIFSGGQ